MAARTPTPDMQRRMRVHLRYLREFQGFTHEHCLQLSADYTAALQTDEGFAAIDAHLKSVTPSEAKAIGVLAP